MTETFVYDDGCGFCSWWAALFAERTDFGIVGFSELTDEERERLPDDYEECVHLLVDGEGDDADDGGRVYSCGAAIEEALARAGLVPREVVEFLGQFADYDRYRERLYEEAADRRDLWGFVLSRDPPARREPEG